MMRAHFPYTVVCVIIAFLCCSHAEKALAADANLLKFDLGKAAAKNATMTPIQDRTGPAMKIGIKGKQEGWAGVELPAPGGTWDLSKYCFVVAQVRSLGTKPVAVRLRLENANTANCVTDGIDIDPRWGWTWTKVPIRRPADTVKIKMFGMAEYPWGRPYEYRMLLPDGQDLSNYDHWWFATYPWGRPYAKQEAGVDPAKVSKLAVLVTDPKDCTFEIRTIRAAGVAPTPEMLADPAKFFPCIDEFGQYIHADWPGKIHEPADLKKALAAEEKDLKANPGPQEWNQYGGWKNGPTLKATGFFRVEKVRGKWWLVDPDGKLFFSHGIANVVPSYQPLWKVPPPAHSIGQTTIENRQHWFKGLPALEAEFGWCVGNNYTQRKTGYYPEGSIWHCFDFPGANNSRKYGGQGDWAENFAANTHSRFRSWGMNTLGFYTSPAIKAKKKTPYVAFIWMHHLVSFVWAKNAKGETVGHTYDAWEKDFAGMLNMHCTQEFGPLKDDPWCIGVILDADHMGGPVMNLGDDEIALGIGAIMMPPAEGANPNHKKVFVEDLKAKYGAVEKLNATWGTKFASWDELLNNRYALPQGLDLSKAHDDLATIQLKIQEAYFKAVRECLKQTVPNHLYLGYISSYQTQSSIKAAAKYCDVVSYRLNWPSPAGLKLPAGIDVPVMAVEFGFSALDRGLLAGTLPDQAARAAAYRNYVLGALKHPQFVGCHWAQYRDDPASGQAATEGNYNIGFVDLADTPYAEMVRAAREVGKTMYRTRLGAE